MVSALAVRRERAPKVGEAHERYAVPDTLALHLAHEGLDGAVHLRAARCRLNGMRRGTHWQRAAEGTYVEARLWYTTVPGVHKGVQHKVLQRATAVLWRMRPLQG